MRKYSKIIAPLLALMLAFALAGCGEDAPATSGLAESSPWENNVLQIETLKNWSGLDIVGGAGGIIFAADDVIEIEVMPLSGGFQVLLQAAAASWSPFNNWNPAVSAGTPVSKEITLTQAEVDTIVTNADSPANIRVRTNQANSKFVITKLVYKTGSTVKLDLIAAIADKDTGDLDDAGVKAIKAGFLQPAGGAADVQFKILGP